MSAFDFACPKCRKPVVAISRTSYLCEEENLSYPIENGIWRFLPPDRAAHFNQFIEDYETIRLAENRSGETERYYQALPFEDLSGRFSAEWKIRARSYQAFLEEILIPFEKYYGDPLKVLDVGAGNGWLSNCLAQREHHVCAIDLVTNPWDGLGAIIHYDVNFLTIQAEFDHLPLIADQVDILIFNASLHYSENYVTTLSEAMRVLKDTGLLIIMDSPIYKDPKSGVLMVQEREKIFTELYGHASNALNSENYLTFDGLASLGAELGIQWQSVKPFYGFAWAIKPWIAWLRRHREPAKFLILAGKKNPR